jgi:antitoxin VapB
MSLNIKDTETHEWVRELSNLTGESMTRAVKLSVKERLERKKQSNKREGRLEWLLKLSDRTAPLLKDLPPSDKVGDLLFDQETGLPL